MHPLALLLDAYFRAAVLMTSANAQFVWLMLGRR
jgi:hypothetical protein